MLALGATATALSLVVSAADAARGRSQRALPAWAFALLPLVGFTLQEHLERWLASGVLPWHEFAAPTFLPGLALQLPFGLLAYLAARLLLRAAEDAGRVLRLCGARPAAVGRARPGRAGARAGAAARDADLARPGQARPASPARRLNRAAATLRPAETVAQKRREEMTPRTRLGAVALASGIALVVAAGASAHAIVSPPVAAAKKLQQFTLSVPTEKEGATTTKIELIVPPGFAIDSFEPTTPGWKQQVQSTGNGDSAVVQKVIWTGGATPTDEDSVFRFNASTSGAKTYTFDVKQTYSDGSLVDWNGTESSDTPAPTVEAVSSLGGGGSTSTLAIVALALGGLALVISVAGLLVRGGGRAIA